MPGIAIWNTTGGTGQSSIAANIRMATSTTFLSGKHCLLLEDEFLIALDIQQILETAGARVAPFNDPAQAIDAIKRGETFAVAVLDIKMSDSAATGVSVAALLTEHGTPFVFLTGMRADSAEARAFPHAPVVEKPYQVELLVAALRQALGAA